MVSEYPMPPPLSPPTALSYINICFHLQHYGYSLDSQSVEEKLIPAVSYDPEFSAISCEFMVRIFILRQSLTV